MFKKIMFTGVLLISISVLNAKSITPLITFVPTTIIRTTDEGLVNKLVADNDFKNYCISQVKFANKIIETKSGSLFHKFLQKQITSNELALLLKHLKLNNKNELNDIAIKLRAEAIAFFNKFPELMQMTEKEKRELLLDAVKRLSINNSINIKFVKARNVTVEQCFWTWMVCNGLCAITCTYEPPSNYGDCMWQCGLGCAGAYGFCWFLATE